MAGRDRFCRGILINQTRPPDHSTDLSAEFTPSHQTSSIFEVLARSFSQTIQPLCSHFAIRSGQRNEAFIHFDPGENALVSKEIPKEFIFVVVLVKSFVREDHNGDMSRQLFRAAEEYLTVETTILFAIVEIHQLKTFRQKSYGRGEVDCQARFF